MAAAYSNLPGRLLLSRCGGLGVSAGGRRCFAKNSHNSIRRRANEQHVDYFRQLKGPRSYRPIEVDPKVHRGVDEVRQQLRYPNLVRQQPQEDLGLRPSADALAAALTPKLAGQVGSVDMEPFGSIEVEHGDIFAAEAQAVILPMTANLMPYRGLSLEAFDRGGRGIVEEAFSQARSLWEGQGRSGEGLVAGDVIEVSGKGVAADKVLFVVMPWFWQGSPMDAAKRFRFVVRAALLHASTAQGSREQGFSSVALPNLGSGIFGYEPRSSSKILVEEAVETLLQIEAQVPNYALQRVTFVDSRRETADELVDALTEVSHLWLPERKLTTAAQWWSKESNRLVLLPAGGQFFWRRHRVKFKKFHGIPRKARKSYIGNMKPWFWRAQRVQQPPPLMVYSASGDVAPLDRQHPARPFYFRGVSHWLFPSRKSGFHALRKGAKGNWVASSQRYRLQADFRPRM